MAISFGRCKTARKGCTEIVHSRNDPIFSKTPPLFVGICAFGTITAAEMVPTTPYGAFASAAEGMRILQVFGKINF